MKQLNTILTFLLLPGFLLAATPKINLGQSMEQTIQVLGQPIGTLALGNKMILLYPQGDVTLRENKVSDIDLLEEDAFAAEQERKRLEREEWLIRQEKLSADRLERGSKIKAAKLQSRAFSALSAKQQVDYWRTFQTQHPEVDVTEQIASALEAYQADLAEQQTQKRIAELEARVAQAEQAAAVAKHENESLRHQTSAQNRIHDSRYTYYTRFYRVCYPQNKVTIYSKKGKVVRYPHRNSNYQKSDRRTQTCGRSESTAEQASLTFKY